MTFVKGSLSSTTSNSIYQIIHVLALSNECSRTLWVYSLLINLQNFVDFHVSDDDVKSNVKVLWSVLKTRCPLSRYLSKFSQAGTDVCNSFFFIGLASLRGLQCVRSVNDRLFSSVELWVWVYPSIWRTLKIFMRQCQGFVISSEN